MYVPTSIKLSKDVEEKCTEVDKILRQSRKMTTYSDKPVEMAKLGYELAGYYSMMTTLQLECEPRENEFINMYMDDQDGKKISDKKLWAMWSMTEYGYLHNMVEKTMKALSKAMRMSSSGTFVSNQASKGQW